MMLLTLMFTNFTRGDGLIIIDNPPVRARTDHFAFAPLEVSYHHVSVEINDRIATTSVDQEFFNRNSQRLEGTYLFPLPEGATIDKFSMDIDGRQTDAELLDATKARSTYEEIVRKYRDPALLEYVGRGAMKVRIFPIEPNSPKRIQLKYTQVLKADQEVTEYVYPLNTEKFSSAPLREVSIRLKLNSNTPIRSIYSPTHSIEVRRENDRSVVVGFEARNSRPDTDFRLIVTRQPDPIGVNLFTYTKGSDGYFMLLASPGADIAAGQIQNKDICFVLDTSGSMAGDKLEQAKKALNFCLANLNEGDRFELIRFSTEAESVFGKLQTADKASVDKARAFVRDLKPIGGTAIYDALKKALTGLDKDRTNDRPYVVIFLTDGQPTIGETKEDPIVDLAKRPNMGNVKIFSFGIGTDVNTTLLDRIANETNAFSQYVLPTEDIEVKVSGFYSKIQSPVLSNVQFSVDNPNIKLTQVYPGTLPDLYKGETLIAFGKFTSTGDPATRPGSAKITLSGTINGAKREVVSQVNFNSDDPRNSFIPRLWATRRIGWLLDEIRLRGESKELKDEITQLAREHGIVTPYTAYLIMEDERNRGVTPTLRTMQEMDRDELMRLRTGQVYNSANGSSGQLQRAGDVAVSNGMALNSMKQATNSAELQQQAGQQSLAKATPASPGYGMRGGGSGGGFGAAAAGGRGGRTGGGAFGGATGTVPAATPAPAEPPSQGYKVAQNYAEQVKVVNGRAFYQNGNIWTDNTAQEKKDLKRKEVKFNSDEYFDLLVKHPDALPWFSLGSDVDVVIDDTLYVIRAS
jgi:Ca-activated chloride channel family protein